MVDGRRLLFEDILSMFSPIHTPLPDFQALSLLAIPPAKCTAVRVNGQGVGGRVLLPPEYTTIVDSDIRCHAHFVG